MLTRVRIEVEEETAEKCVLALWKYEHALQVAEARRYVDMWSVEVTAQEFDPANPTEPVEIDAEEQYGIREHPWSDDLVPRSFFNNELGRELVEEVIEYDESIPGYKGRRVVRFTRTDTRNRNFFVSIKPVVELRDATGAFVTTVGTGTNPDAA